MQKSWWLGLVMIAVMGNFAWAKRQKDKTEVEDKVRTVSIVPEQSQVKWEGKKKIGEAHHGLLAIKSGQVQMRGQEIIGGQVELDLTSLKVTDIPEGDKNNKKLSDHLKSNDFFSVTQFPTATFVIHSAKMIEPGVYELAGDMTIKGQTQPETIRVNVETKGDQLIAKGRLKVDRTKYGVKYGSANFFKLAADRIINDEFELDFNVVAR